MKTSFNAQMTLDASVPPCPNNRHASMMKTPDSIRLEQHPKHTAIFIKNHWHPFQLIWMTGFLVFWCNIFYQFFGKKFTECGWSVGMLQQSEGGGMFLVLMLAWAGAALYQLHNIVHALFGGEAIEIRPDRITVRKRWHLWHPVWRYKPEKMSTVSIRRPETAEMLRKMPKFIQQHASYPIHFNYQNNPDDVLTATNLQHAEAAFILQTLLDTGVLKETQLAV